MVHCRFLIHAMCLFLSFCLLVWLRAAHGFVVGEQTRKSTLSSKVGWNFLFFCRRFSPNLTFLTPLVRFDQTANPDGREYLENGGEKTLWKKNRNKGTCASDGFGVDPNRNFPFKWGQCVTTSDNRCSSSDDCSSVVYRGPSPSSERETKAILAYAASIFPFKQRKGNVKVSEEKMNTPFATDSEGVFIDVHSHGRDVGWPWGFANQRTPNDAGLGALGRKFASFSGYSLWAPKMPNRGCESERCLRRACRM